MDVLFQYIYLFFKNLSFYSRKEIENIFIMDPSFDIHSGQSHLILAK